MTRANNTIRGRAVLRWIACLLIGFQWPVPVMATSPVIEDIAFRALPGAQLEVQLTFSEPPPAETQSYSIEDPARIVLDFPDTGNALGQKALPVIAGGRHQRACSRVRRSYANDRESG